MDLATAFLLVVSAVIWTAALLVCREVWLTWRSPDRGETYEPDPEDGCGCVGIWEYTSARRSESD